MNGTTSLHSLQSKLIGPPELAELLLISVPALYKAIERG